MVTVSKKAASMIVSVERFLDAAPEAGRERRGQREKQIVDGRPCSNRIGIGPCRKRLGETYCGDGGRPGPSGGGRRPAFTVDSSVTAPWSLRGQVGHPRLRDPGARTRITSMSRTGDEIGYCAPALGAVRGLRDIHGLPKLTTRMERTPAKAATPDINNHAAAGRGIG